MLLQTLAPSPSCSFGPEHELPDPGKDEATRKWGKAGTGPSVLQVQQLRGASTPCALLDSASLSLYSYWGDDSHLPVGHGAG